MSFSPIKNPVLLILREDWSQIRVPALPRQTLTRLRNLRFEDISRLAVIEQYQNRGGQLVHVKPSFPAGDIDSGLRWLGNELKLGLTQTEIEQVYARARALVERVDEQELGTF
jgi:hypothetical protein